MGFKVFRRVSLDVISGNFKLVEDHEIILRVEDITKCEAVTLYFSEYDITLDENNSICESDDGDYFMECTRIYYKTASEESAFNVPMSVYLLVKYLKDEYSSS